MTLIHRDRPPGPSPTSQMSALIRQIKREDAGLPDPFTLPLAAARAQFNAGAARWNHSLPEMAVARTEKVACGDADHPVLANLRIPPDARPGTIVYIHGGGWVFGSPDTHERAIRYLAQTTGMTVVAPYYRLAPEAPFPAALQDVRVAISAIRAVSPEWNVKTGPFGLAGDSAGANLALVALLDAQRARTTLSDFAMLFYGVYNADFTTGSYTMADPDYGLTADRMRAYWDRYVPGLPARENPLASPLQAKDEALRALPPLYLNAAEIDPLRDDTLGLAARLKGLGRDQDTCQLHRGVVHGFMQMTIALEEARLAFDLAADWLDSTVGPKR